MEACLGLGRSQRNRNKQQQKDIKLQHQHQQQHTQFQHRKQQTQAIITNQNYYTTQQQSPNQRYLVARGQTTNVGALKPELQQQQHNEESHLVRQQHQQHVQHNATSTQFTTTPQYRNTTAIANMQQPSFSTANGSADDGGSIGQQQPQPQTISFPKNMVTVEVTPTLPSTVSPTNTPGIVTSANVKTFRKINRQAHQQHQQHRQQQHQFQQHILHQQQQLEADLDAIEVCADPEPHASFKDCGGGLLRQTKTLGRLNHQHQHHHSIEDQHGQLTEITSLQLLQQQQQQQQQHKYHHQQQQQLEADLDAIEVCVDPEPRVSFKGGGGLLRQSKTLGRFNHQHQHHHSIEDQHGQCTNKSQATSLQLLQLQQQQQEQQQQHDYSYAYYEPGAVMRHTNIPHADLMAGKNEEEDLIPPPPNSIRALLLKGKNNKLLVSPTTRESYQIRLTHQQNHNEAGGMASTNCSNTSTAENVYEEISASSTSSSSNSITSPQQLRASSHSAGSLARSLLEEELKRVQNRHQRILGELNLSVEAMLMPESPPKSSLTTKEPPKPSVSVTLASGQPLQLTSLSSDNICDASLTGGPSDDFISPIPNSATVSAGLLQSSCLAADLDSGFSGSSGASYIGALRLHKTKALMSSRSNNLPSTATAAAGSNVAAKSQKSAFAYAKQCCRSFKRANSNNTNATATSASSSSKLAAVSATTSSCTVKYLPQIHHNTKQQQQQLHKHHQHHQHHHSHLHQHHHPHQEQQHPHQQHQPSHHLQNSSGFFTRASCGCRILNCARIRAAEDPGPVVLNAQPKESKARSFWNHKGWRKSPGFSTSSSNINDPG